MILLPSIVKAMVSNGPTPYLARCDLPVVSRALCDASCVLNVSCREKSFFSPQLDIGEQKTEAG
jgi:hypothetical protein